MPEMRDWDEEFRHMAELNDQGNENLGDLEDIPHLAVVDLNQFEAYGEYINLLRQKEQMEVVKVKVIANLLQSRSALQGMMSLSLLSGIVLSFGWTIWYWVH